MGYDDVPAGGADHTAVHRDIATALDGAQPLDADLTAIAALTTTAYGRGLLTLADQAALQAEAGGGGGDNLTGANGGEGEPGGDVYLQGGSGDNGDDAGASITVYGGDGVGGAGRVGITTDNSAGTDGQVLTAQGDGTALWTSGPTLAQVLASGADPNGVALTGPLIVQAVVKGADAGTEGAGQFSVSAASSGVNGGSARLTGGDAGAGLPGGSAYLDGGYGDDENDAGAAIVVGGGNGSGNAGVVTVTSNGVTFTLNQAAYVDPGSGSAADIIAALIAAGLMAAS